MRKLMKIIGSLGGAGGAGGGGGVEGFGLPEGLGGLDEDGLDPGEAKAFYRTGGVGSSEEREESDDDDVDREGAVEYQRAMDEELDATADSTLSKRYRAATLVRQAIDRPASTCSAFCSAPSPAM